MVRGLLFEVCPKKVTLIQYRKEVNSTVPLKLSQFSYHHLTVTVQLREQVFKKFTDEREDGKIMTFVELVAHVLELVLV